MQVQSRWLAHVASMELFASAADSPSNTSHGPLAAELGSRRASVVGCVASRGNDGSLGGADGRDGSAQPSVSTTHIARGHHHGDTALIWLTDRLMFSGGP